MKSLAVIAIGGNSLAPPGERGTFEECRRHARITCESIADILEAGYRAVLTHGNGPQVGDALLRSEIAEPHLPALRLDVCDAETQGSIGYLLQQTLADVLAARGRRATVATIVTQVVVDAEDPAFHKPTKPIGPFYSLAEALEKKEKFGWAMVEDAGRGWRRVVASPRPREIVELHAIRACLGSGDVVIAAGGGGIPVVCRGGRLHGVEAVIDKDRASALLARNLHAERLIFSTGVARVAVRFGQPEQQEFGHLAWEQARRFLTEGEFPPGNMGPKIEAALEFLCAGGERAAITSPELLALALEGLAGTQILPPSLVRRPRTTAVA